MDRAGAFFGAAGRLRDLPASPWRPSHGELPIHGPHVGVSGPLPAAKESA